METRQSAIVSSILCVTQIVSGSVGPLPDWTTQSVVTAFLAAVPGTVSCGRLDDPEQGMVSLDSTLPGSVATYSCTLGYVLVGRARERRCQDNGTWDGTEPTCDGIAPV